jgi:hypothetical protein
VGMSCRKMVFFRRKEGAADVSLRSDGLDGRDASTVAGSGSKGKLITYFLVSLISVLTML